MMEYKPGGLTRRLAYILCWFFLLLLSWSAKSEQLYTVQIAASKSPLSIDHFARVHNVSEVIQEINIDGWYRYCVGNFENLQLASRYAEELKQQTDIKGAFPREMTWVSANTPAESPDRFSPEINKESNDTTRQSVSGPQVQPKVPVKSENLHQREKSFIWRFIGSKNINELKDELIRYGQKNFPPHLKRVFERVVLKIYSYPIILFLVLVILMFIVNILAVLLILYYSNRFKNHRDKYIRVYRNMYEGVLRSYLFGEIGWELACQKFKRLKKRLNRRIMADVLIDFQNNLRGSMDGQLNDIYTGLNLHLDAIRTTRHGFYHDKVLALRELTNLSPQFAMEIVQKYVNHPHNLVRVEAQTLYVTLHPHNPLGFLKDLKSPFTRWTQVNVFYLFKLNQLTVPAFVHFLDSGNPRVRNFSLRMMIYFQQLENTDEILNLLDNQSEMTRFFAIRAINDLRVFHGRDRIKSMYMQETDKNRIEIIKALRNIGMAEDFDFLESIIQHGTITERTEACRTLYFMNQDSRNYLEHLNQKSNLELDKYIAHITDPRN